MIITFFLQKKKSLRIKICHQKNLNDLENDWISYCFISNTINSDQDPSTALNYDEGKKILIIFICLDKYFQN